MEVVQSTWFFLLRKVKHFLSKDQYYLGVFQVENGLASHSELAILYV